MPLNNWSTRSLGKLGKYEDALLCAEKAISLNPNIAIPWKNKAHALEKLGRVEESKKYYEKANSVEQSF